MSKKLKFLSVSSIILIIFIIYSCGSLISCGSSESESVAKRAEDVSIDSAAQVRFDLIMEDVNVEERTSDSIQRVREQIMVESHSPVRHDTIDNTHGRRIDGTFMYQIDTIFIINVTSRVEARIIKKIYDTIPKYVIELFHTSTNGTVKKDYIETSEIMDVNLVCLDLDAFAINKINNDQPVDENTLTEWIWGVTPKKIGNFNLILKVSVKKNNITKDRIVFDKVINVQNKPKRYFHIDIKKASTLKNLSTRTITCTITETTSSDTTAFRWGGNGKIVIDFQRPSNFTITKEGDETMNDDKGLFITKWSVTPDTKLKEADMKITIIGDNSQITIYEEKITIDRNFKAKFNDFVDKTLQRWYWVFSVLLIPIYNYTKKKISPEKKIFTRKKRTTKPK